MIHWCLYIKIRDIIIRMFTYREENRGKENFYQKNIYGREKKHEQEKTKHRF